MPAHSRGQAHVVNGKIYVLSGNTYGTTNEVYDPVTDSWAEKTSEPYATFRWASVALDGKIYVLGGFDPLASGAQTNAIYDPNRDTWSAGAFPPLTIYGGAAAATVGVSAPKRIYIMGLGFGETLYPNYMYDPEQNTWVAVASMPDGRTNFGIAVVDDGLYVIGGDSNALYEKSADTGDWTPSAVNAQYIPIGYGTPDPSYVLEHNPPKISLLSPINQTYNESSVSLVFTVDKTVNWTSYSLDGQQNVTVTGNSTLINGTVANFTISNMTKGLHHITVYANDTFGNIGASDTVSFTVATAESFPTVPILIVIAAGLVVAGAGFLLYRKRGRGKTQ
jgi:hypothetical protein